MGQFRMVVRFTLIAVMTTVLVVFRVLGMPLALVSPRLERRYRAFVAGLWGRCMAWIMGMHIQVTGQPPPAPFFLVANHLSYIDTFLLIALTGGTFVSRADVEGWPLAGIVAKAANTIFIDRSKIRDTKRVNEIIQKELDRGTGIIVYAEAGTGPGDAVRPFKSSLLEPAVAGNLPVHYCTIRYETFAGEPPARTAVVWHAPITFMRHAMNVLQLRGFVATVHFGPGPVYSEDRKELAAKLHEAVQSQFQPVV